MKRSVLEIYALAVCFGAVICLVIASGIAIYDIVRVVDPELTLNQYEYNRHQTNDAFWQSNPQQFEFREGSSSITKAIPADGGMPKRPAEKLLTEKRLDSLELALKGEARDGLQSLIRTTILVVTSAILFVLHWRLARRAREESHSDRA